MRNPFWKPLRRRHPMKLHTFILEGDTTGEFELVVARTNSRTQLIGEAIEQFRWKTGETGKVSVHNVEEDK